jgi:hypothetical protein
MSAGERGVGMGSRTSIAVLVAAGSGLFALVRLTHGGAAFAEVGVAATGTGPFAWLSADKPSKKRPGRSAAGQRPALGGVPHSPGLAAPKKILAPVFLLSTPPATPELVA